ncbi:cytochrome P450 [Sediminitomix flava]|uniref:Cytochrome P450 n=1 Tax=Sediminitomix flava TaxID=379075 RepID=A0A315ZHS1_SEDFL|nr:cytochrome P450 [Sediminitomix flava]PWJ45081.1 cytochrome P450 [Sediminitomix flava]
MNTETQTSTFDKQIPLQKNPNNRFLNLFRFIRDSLPFLQENERKYGGFYEIELGFSKLVILSEPELVKDVLQHQHKSFIKSPEYEVLSDLLGKGLLTSEGDHWQHQRKLIQPSFHKSYLQKIYALMLDEIVKAADTLSQKPERSIEINQEMMRLTLNVVTRSILGSQMTPDSDKIHDTVTDLLKYGTSRIRNPFFRLLYPISYQKYKSTQHIKYLDNLVYKIIEERQRTQHPHRDLLQMLLDSRMEDTGKAMPLRQVRDEIMTFMMAGHETIASALSFIFAHLVHDPKLYKKVQEELKQVLDGRHPDFEDLPKLQLLQQIIDEALRLYPSAWVVGRKAKESVKVGNTIFPKDSVFLINIFAMHRSDRFWKKAEEFQVDRFTSDFKKNMNKFQYIPFGLGPRMCIGNHFAQFEMLTVLAVYLQKFNMLALDEELPKPKNTLTLRPSKPIRILYR